VGNKLCMHFAVSDLVIYCELFFKQSVVVGNAKI